MEQLDRNGLDALPPFVRRPRYDRTQLAIGMAHLGVGAFHRCHQAEYTDDMLEAEFGPWGVVGINLRPPELEPMLGMQDGLYVRCLRADDGGPQYRAIGCIRAVIDGGGHPGRALSALADPQIGVATLTVTEKGYCHVPATGTLDEVHPDVLHDLANPEMPRSLPGFLVAALERRMASGGAALTLLSCDNIPGNGSILERVVRGVAIQRSQVLERWIADNVSFPSSMVDRIVPALTRGAAIHDHARLCDVAQSAHPAPDRVRFAWRRRDDDCGFVARDMVLTLRLDAWLKDSLPCSGPPIA